MSNNNLNDTSGNTIGIYGDYQNNILSNLSSSSIYTERGDILINFNEKATVSEQEVKEEPSPEKVEEKEEPAEETQEVADELAPELEIKGYANMFSTIKTADHKSIRHPLLDEGLEASYAFPPKSNLKYYLPYDQIDTGDFTYELETNPDAIDSGLPTRITCRNEGKWTVVNQYQLDCLKDSVTGPEEISGFSTFGNLLNGDGEPVPNSSATCSVEKKGDKVVLVIAFTADMKEGDYFKVGVVSTNAEVAIINSYPGATGLVDPICITLCTRNGDIEPPNSDNFLGYANMFSTIKTSEHPSIKHPLLEKGLEADYAFPPESNKKHYLPYDQTDGGDFEFQKETNAKAVDYDLPTRITCKNAGNWTIINQYQLDCLQDSELGPEQISGFTTFGNVLDGDGEPLDNSSATCTVEKKGDKVVLVIAFTADMKEGDYFKVGVVSSNAEVAIINSYPGATGLVDPICITLCTRNGDVLGEDYKDNFKGYANMFSTVKTSELDSIAHPLLDVKLAADYAFPPSSNDKHYLPYDMKDTDDFSFELESKAGAIDNGLPTRITCKNAGNWTIINQYQLDCLRDSVSGPEQISGFSTFGSLMSGDGEPVPNSSATCTVEKKGDKVVLVIAFTADFKKDDYFKVGVVSSNAMAAIINSYPGVTELVDPICITLCTKNRDN